MPSYYAKLKWIPLKTMAPLSDTISLGMLPEEASYRNWLIRTDRKISRL